MNINERSVARPADLLRHTMDHGTMPGTMPVRPLASHNTRSKQMHMRYYTTSLNIHCLPGRICRFP